MSDQSGLLCGFLLNGKGGGKSIGWSDFSSFAETEPPPHWLHLDRHDASVHDWLRGQSGIEPLAVESLLAEETRPRFTPLGQGAIVNLRGINPSPEAAPEDMVSIRIWIEKHRVVSVRLRTLGTADDISRAIEEGRGPKTPSDVILSFAQRLTERVATVVLDLEEELDAIDDVAAQQTAQTLRERLSETRKQAVALRRFLNPQRDALARLAGEEPQLFSQRQRQHLHELANESTRYIEALNSAWERTAVLQDEISNLLVEQSNRRLFLLSIVAGVFLPLTFVTGLLGINVSGIPGAGSGLAFTVVCGLLLLIGLLELWLFRRLRWF